MGTPLHIASLTAQRRLTETTARLSSTFERLSSGQRINRAADDAAGLAISQGLQQGARVYTQAIRNVNDGVSALNIAEGALGELSAISLRQKELAEQAANGTYSLAQRRALNAEANALVDEFNRIVESTSFNGMYLTDGSISELRIQAGRGTDGSISIAITDELARTAGNGSFSTGTVFSVGSEPNSITLGDLNGDDVLDMVTVDRASDEASVLIGNGNGTFLARTALVTGDSPRTVALADLNGDERLDLLTTDAVGDTISIFMGNGNGTFAARTSVNAGNFPSPLALGDLNGDGVLDIVTTDYNGTYTASVLLGRGDGSFSAKTSFATGTDPRGVALGDLNGDDILDIVTADFVGNTASVLLGCGDGRFGVKTSLSTGENPFSVTLGDLNGDGVLDIVSGDYYTNTASVFLGCGNGSFAARRSYATGLGTYSVSLGDLNGDGILDLVSADRSANKASVFLGNGDGSFSTRTSYSTGSEPYAIALGDLNGDGALDMATANQSQDTVSVFLARTTEVTTMPYLNINTRAGALAALDTIEETLGRISSELGALGSTESRFNVALNTLSVLRENFTAAAARIQDVDVAEESAALVRNQILQQAGTAVLAQAQQQPALLWQLLSP